jgi:predicted dehydrogenase
MNPLRCAVVGAGWWACEAHLPALKTHPHARIVAVQKRSRDAAEKVARDFGAERACTTIEEVLAPGDLDAVIIASTPNMHYDQARAALKAGLHVLLEKPMTLTAAESRELLEIAGQNGLQFLVSCPWHYTGHTIEAARLIREGALGGLKMISILMTNFVAGLYQGLPWGETFNQETETIQTAAKPYLEPNRASYSDPKVAGGGHVYCQISHVAALIHFLTALPAREVFARFDRAGTQVDVYDAINLTLGGGALVSIASHGAPIHTDRQFEVRIYGTSGMLLMDLWKGLMEFHPASGHVVKYPPLTEEQAYPMFSPAANLVDCALGLAPNGSPACHGVFAMEVIEAACQSADSSRNIVLP